MAIFSCAVQHTLLICFSSLCLSPLPHLSPPPSLSLLVSLFLFCYIHWLFLNSHVSDNTEHLSLSSFMKHKALLVHMCCCKYHYVILLYG